VSDGSLCSCCGEGDLGGEVGVGVDGVGVGLREDGVDGSGGDLPQAAWPLKAFQVVFLADLWMAVMAVATKMVESNRRGGKGEG
jgi:hypothetical protein